ncbi:L,D-transpeptidase [Thiorhodococcus minor]|uniref:L,D-transpeptidase n=1 Tax=Thiorhodococcus minor TaxID=57489 RepID=A0A6M0K4B4_9GAMM|nr:L,D-transpeptidase [Thiorhodococcus minor]NEV64626.1 L,D-transpeptidase [Thiorhodococcus minor]
MTQRIDRRTALLRLAALSAAPLYLTSRSLSCEVIKEVRDLEPGQFTWHPERSPKGAVAVVVSLEQQLAHVYRNGTRIAVSTCSTGKPGHETPTGVFTVLQKDKHHHSSTYNNAPMPNMNRLTWDGIALHAGRLPGYPASHGCVRLPMAFSERLWTVTHVGTPVIIAGSHTDPWEMTHPGMVLGAYAAEELEDAVDGLEGKRHPADWTREQDGYPITTVVASTADRTIDLLENSRVVAQGRLSVKGDAASVGSHVFILKGLHAGGRGLSWHAISHHERADRSLAARSSAEDPLVASLKADAAFQRALKQHMHPGMVMILTDMPLHPDRRSGEDFVILSSTA